MGKAKLQQQIFTDSVPYPSLPRPSLGQAQRRFSEAVSSNCTSAGPDCLLSMVSLLRTGLDGSQLSDAWVIMFKGSKELLSDQLALALLSASYPRRKPTGL